MSKFSEYEHKLADFLAEEAAKVAGFIGKPIVDAALDGAADEIETVRAEVARVLEAYLQSKGLGAANGFVDGLTHNIANALELAVHALKPA